MSPWIKLIREQNSFDHQNDALNNIIASVLLSTFSDTEELSLDTMEEIQAARGNKPPEKVSVKGGDKP